ncbi:hypothetical protein VTH06DRAFT_6762 [Thermothelomyces fergusii]
MRTPHSFQLRCLYHRAGCFQADSTGSNKPGRNTRPIHPSGACMENLGIVYFVPSAKLPRSQSAPASLSSSSSDFPFAPLARASRSELPPMCLRPMKMLGTVRWPVRLNSAFWISSPSSSSFSSTALYFALRSPRICFVLEQYGQYDLLKTTAYGG